MYHIYADGDPDMLAFNLAHIGMYRHIFDHAYFKITYDNPEKLLNLFPYLIIWEHSKSTVWKYQNDPSQGENIGFMEVLNDIHNHLYNLDTLLLIGSTNGVSKSGEREAQKKNIRAWTKAAMHLSMRDMKLVEHAMTHGYHCVGSFKRDVPIDKGGPYPCPWHYSGLFYWLKCSELFKRNWNTALANSRHGIEMYPGYIFNSSEAYCIFNTDQDTYQEEVKDEQWINNTGTLVI